MRFSELSERNSQVIVKVYIELSDDMWSGTSTARSAPTHRELERIHNLLIFSQPTLSHSKVSSSVERSIPGHYEHKERQDPLNVRKCF